MELLNRAELLCRVVHEAWGAVSLALGEAPVSWEAAPMWRKGALVHTVGFWETWDDYDGFTDLDIQTFAATTHFTWMQYHKRHAWKHTQLTDWRDLPRDQQQKTLAMLRAYLFYRALLDQTV